MSPTYVLLLHTYIHISKYVSRLVIFSKYKYEREGLNRNTNLSAFSRRDSRSSNAFFGRDRRGGGKGGRADPPRGGWMEVGGREAHALG